VDAPRGTGRPLHDANRAIIEGAQPCGQDPLLTRLLRSETGAQFFGWGETSEIIVPQSETCVNTAQVGVQGADAVMWSSA
jgi:hypothetical protein